MWLFVLLAIAPLIAADRSITIGTLDATQQLILGQLLGVYLEDKGFRVDYEVELSSITLHRAMAEGIVELAWEDPAVVWFLKYLKVEILADEELYQKVKELDEQEGLLWLGRSELEKQHVLVMQGERAEELEIETVSDLADYIEENTREIKVAMEDECFFRPDCYTSLKETYDLSISRADITTTMSGVGFGLLSSGEVDVLVALSTAPLITELELVKLVDDREALSPHRIGIVAREEVVGETAEISGLVGELIELSPSTSEMAQLNLRVHRGEDAEEVAREFLKKKGLIETGGV